MNCNENCNIEFGKVIEYFKLFSPNIYYYLLLSFIEIIYYFKKYSQLIQYVSINI